MNPRQQIIKDIADRIPALSQNSIVRVGIDGDAGAGKSTFGDELALALLPCDRPLIRASIDSFHNPREVRYRRGKMSPDGFFLDSHDHDSLIKFLLEPLSPGGSRQFRRAAFDHLTDSAVSAPEEIAADNAILIFDGIFLHRPELADYWDYSVFLDVSTATGLHRCAMRGDGSADPQADSNYRYVEGQKKYLLDCKPTEFATLVIDHEDFENPKIKPNRVCSQ